MFDFAKANQNMNAFSSAACAEAVSSCACFENSMMITMGAIIMASIIILLSIHSLRLMLLGLVFIHAIRLVQNRDYCERLD